MVNTCIFLVYTYGAPSRIDVIINCLSRFQRLLSSYQYAGIYQLCLGRYVGRRISKSSDSHCRKPILDVPDIHPDHRRESALRWL